MKYRLKHAVKDTIIVFNNHINMETIVEEVVSPEELKKFARIYNEQVMRGSPSVKSQFDYAWCLVRSPDKSDIAHGLAILQDLFQRASDDNLQRDYLFYMSIGNTRIKEYTLALKYVNALLTIEPSNHQARDLRRYINKKMKVDGIVGMAIVGGVAALAIGGIVSLKMALSK